MNALLLIAPTSDLRKQVLAAQFPQAQVLFDNDLVTADDARKAREYIVLSPQIFDATYYMGGDRWGVEAEQTLLKLCEELPAKVTIIIGASFEGDLLSTLTSRLMLVTEAPSLGGGKGVDSISAKSSRGVNSILLKELLNNLDTIDTYDTPTIINAIRTDLQKNPDTKKAMHLERALEVMTSKKLTDKQVKEMLVLVG